jgi:hypothetical protein
VVGYLAVWALLVVVLLAAVIVFSFDNKLPLPVFPAFLCVLLLAPLARIGFCPIALERYRHG